MVIPNSVKELLKLDLTSCSMLEFCYRGSELTLGVYFRGYNVKSEQLVKILLKKVPPHFNFLLDDFKTNKSIGITITPKVLKIYFDAITHAIGVDYDLLTGSVLKRKEYKLQNNGYSIYVSGELYGRTEYTNYILPEVVEYAKSVGLNVKQSYLRENGQKYVMCEAPKGPLCVK